jgi:hypothetical protein
VNRAALYGAISVVLALCLIARIVSHPAHGAPPPGSDGSLSPWFEGLMRPDTGTSCCNDSDCRVYSDDKVRITEGAYEIYIDEGWRRVPPEKILHNKANPTGEYVACFLPSMGVLCLVLPSMT